MIEIMLGTSIMVIVLVALLGSFFGQSTLNQNARNMMAAMNDATRVMEQIRQQNVASVVGSTCAQPTPFPSARPAVFDANGNIVSWRNSWNEWLDQQNPGKSLARSGDIYEIVAVTCQDGNAAGAALTSLASYCGSPTAAQAFVGQMGRYEWYPWYAGTDVALTGSPNSPNRHLPTQLGVQTAFDPIRVTVAVGWAQRRAGVGTLPLGGSGSEFTYNTALGGKGVIVAGGEQLRVGPDADNDGVIESPAVLTTMVTCR